MALVVEEEEVVGWASSEWRHRQMEKELMDFNGGDRGESRWRDQNQDQDWDGDGDGNGNAKGPGDRYERAKEAAGWAKVMEQAVGDGCSDGIPRDGNSTDVCRDGTDDSRTDDWRTDNSRTDNSRSSEPTVTKREAPSKGLSVHRIKATENTPRRKHDGYQGPSGAELQTRCDPDINGQPSEEQPSTTPARSTMSSALYNGELGSDSEPQQRNATSPRSSETAVPATGHKQKRASLANGTQTPNGVNALYAGSKTPSATPSASAKNGRMADSPPGSAWPSHLRRRQQADGKPYRRTPTPLRFAIDRTKKHPEAHSTEVMPSPTPSSIPLPPVSLPTHLQLELSSHRPPPLYIHRSVTSDFPYESSRVKLERLLNFLLLPPQLEQVLWFGTLACLDAWLYTITILPLRLLKSFYILGQSWAANLWTEIRFLANFIYTGAGRMWQRRNSRRAPREQQLAEEQSGSSSVATSMQPASSTVVNHVVRNQYNGQEPRASLAQPRSTAAAASAAPPRARRHKRTKSVPSALLPDDKADILKGLLIITTCALLMRLDGSRMYHWVRGQAAIKLYVLYNVLEVGDRLLSALGQDVLECLFSKEALERGSDGHSKVLRPFWLFLIALTYTVAHSTALFYQVITLNVAVNSYSNALITLLMSNQFVEIKSTVFKKFEKDNMFQLTCADVVERFQLWLMLLIIACRNVVETGGLGAGGLGLFGSSFSSSASGSPTSTTATTTTAVNKITNASQIVMNQAQPPLSSASILPRSFTLLPSMLSSSFSAYVPGMGHVLGPFLVVLGSEMMVDWLKHSYITKFNNTRPAIYGRFLDVLAKDYYSNAFGDQNLTKRLGVPVIPLSCLFIRASVQTYHMFQAAWIPQGSRLSASSLSSSSSSLSGSYPTATASATSAMIRWPSQTFDYFLSHMLPTVLTYFTTLLTCLLVFFVLVILKLLLGMALLSFARARYRSMKLREVAMEGSTGATKREAFKEGRGRRASDGGGGGGGGETGDNIDNHDCHPDHHSDQDDQRVGKAYSQREDVRARADVHVVEGGRRIGGWGVVEVDDDKSRWINGAGADVAQDENRPSDDPVDGGGGGDDYDDGSGDDGIKSGGDQNHQQGGRRISDAKRVADGANPSRARRGERERGRGGGRGRGGEEETSTTTGFERVKRYEMVAKRIW